MSNQIFDSNAQKCIDVRCPSGYEAVQGSCLVTDSDKSDCVYDIDNNETIMNYSTPNITFKCTAESSEMVLPELAGNVNVTLNCSLILYKNQLMEVMRYDKAGHPVICGSPRPYDVRRIEFLPGLTELSYIGSSLSIIASTFIIVTHLSFKSLHTLPGKLLTSLSVAFLLGDATMIISGVLSQQIATPVELCSFVGIILHYFFLSRFSLMNCLGFEYTRIFRLAVRMETTTEKALQIKLFALYSFIGWGTPFLITGVTVIINYTVDGAVRYGINVDGNRGLCWINNSIAVAVAFALPVLISIIVNAINFLISVALICMATDRKKDISKVHARVILAIFVTLGITWTFGFIANISDLSWAWYPFVLLNSIQSLFIAIAFLATKKIFKLYSEAFQNIFSNCFHVQNESKPCLDKITQSTP